MYIYNVTYIHIRYNKQVLYNSRINHRQVFCSSLEIERNTCLRISKHKIFKGKILQHCFQETELVQPLCKPIQKLLQTLAIELHMM